MPSKGGKGGKGAKGVKGAKSGKGAKDGKSAKGGKGGRFVSRPAVAKPAAPPSAAGLPAGWAVYVDAERGLPYYHHAVSGQTQWEKPTVAAAGQ